MRIRAVVAVGSVVAVWLVVGSLPGATSGVVRSGDTPSGLIAFTRSDGVYVMRADGTGVRPLRRGLVESQALLNLEWSPDGRWLAFEAGGAIWVVDAVGTHLTRVVAPRGDRGLAHSPTWSPDGDRIAFSLWTKNHSKDRDIWAVNADGTKLHRLLRLAELGADRGVGEIDWSPDGRRIVFASHSGWLAFVYVVNTNGTNLRRLTKEGWICAVEPQWSPDGRRIVLEQSPPKKSIGPDTSEIYVMTVDSGSQVRLTRNGAPDSTPAWSPDGRKIAFVRSNICTSCPAWNTPSASEIFVMNADGSGVRRLTDNSVGEAGPAWQPVVRP